MAWTSTLVFPRTCLFRAVFKKCVLNTGFLSHPSPTLGLGRCQAQDCFCLTSHNDNIQFMRRATTPKVNGVANTHTCMPTKVSPALSQPAVVRPLHGHHCNRVAHTVGTANEDCALTGPAAVDERIRPTQAQAHVHGLGDVEHPQRHFTGHDARERVCLLVQRDLACTFQSALRPGYHSTLARPDTGCAGCRR